MFGYEDPGDAENFIQTNLLEPITVIIDSVPNNFVIVKVPPTSIDDAPHRKAIRQINFFGQFKQVVPEDYIQYSVIGRDKCNQLLKKGNDLIPGISSSMPYYPNNLDQMDKYSLERVHRMLSGGFGITVFFHPTLKHFFMPSQDFMTPRTEDLIQACEIISIAHSLPMFPIINFYGFNEILFNQQEFTYSERSIANDIYGDSSRIKIKASLFRANPSFYNRRIVHNN